MQEASWLLGIPVPVSWKDRGGKDKNPVRPRRKQVLQVRGSTKDPHSQWSLHALLKGETE